MGVIPHLLLLTILIITSNNAISQIDGYNVLKSLSSKDYNANRIYQNGGKWVFKVTEDKKGKKKYKGTLDLVKDSINNKYHYKRQTHEAINHNHEGNITLSVPPFFGYKFLHKVSFLHFSEQIPIVQYELEGMGNPLIHSEGEVKDTFYNPFEYKNQKIDSLQYISDFKYDRIKYNFNDQELECFKEVLNSKCKAGSFITTSYFEPYEYGFVYFSILFPDSTLLEFNLVEVHL